MANTSINIVGNANIDTNKILKKARGSLLVRLWKKIKVFFK